MGHRCRLLFALLALLGTGTLSGQAVRGRVLDPAQHPLVGALVELRDLNGKSLQTVLTSPSGVFQLEVPGPGRYRFRVAAIGYEPRAYAEIQVTSAGLVVADVVLKAMAIQLPDLVAVGRGRFCGKSGLADDTFARLLESAHTALQVMETAVNTRQVAFEVARINTRTLFGSMNNFEMSDTTISPLARWPVQSIDPDTLRVVGFGRTLEPGNENTREYYGPDARVLFSDWFLDSHCFSLDKPDRKHPSDSLHLRFAPARKTKLVDISGELVLDAHNLALLQFSFALNNLPKWMSDGSAGGNMEFSPLPSGLWMTRTWAIWAPSAGVSFDGHLRVNGQLETHGWVLKVMTGDSTKVEPTH